MRQTGDYTYSGSKSVSDRVDGQHSSHENGCGLQSQCYALNTNVKGVDAGSPICTPYIIDVGGVDGPRVLNKDTTSSVFTGSSVPQPFPRGRGHHVCGIPVNLEGRRVVIIFETMYRKPTYKSQGIVYQPESLLADAFINNAPLSPGKFPPGRDYTEDTVHSKAFTQRRCKLCNVIHSSDLHAEYQ